MCSRELNSSMAIAHTVERALDTITYGLLGHHKWRLSKFGFLYPWTSTVCAAQAALLELVVDWRHEAAAWILLRLVGGAFDEEKAERLAREEALRTCMGIFDYVELILSRPPYTLA